MPELPEVETARRMLEGIAKKKKITGITVKDDPIIFSKIRPATLRRELLGEVVDQVDRRGKYFWLKFRSGKYLVFHFGMSGWLHALAPTDATPKFTKCILEFTGNRRIAYTDPRRLGRVWMSTDIDEDPRISKLGRDVLDEPLSSAELFSITSQRRVPIKALLLNQEIFAGVGNWIADEALYQAGISPHRAANSLSKVEVGRLLRSLKKILTVAIAHYADDSKFPPNWLFHLRWGKGKKTRDGKRPLMKFDTIGGRTSAWVPSKQR